MNMNESTKMNKPNYDCTICNRIIPISDKLSHEKGRSHLFKLKSAKRSPTIIVQRNGSPLAKKLYQEFFEQFGPVKNVYIGGNMKKVAVTFADAKHAQSALQSRDNLFLKGYKLLITEKQEAQPAETQTAQNVKLKPIPTLVKGVIQGKAVKPSGQKKQSKEIKPSLPPKHDIPPIKAFILRGDFDQQLRTFVQELRVKPHIIENMQFLGDDIQNVLNRRFPGSRVVPFGSIVNGLAIVGSDVDCYVEIPDQSRCNLILCDSGRNRARTPGSGPTLMSLAKSAFFKCPQIFSHVFMIPSTNVPIIKCLHIPSGFNVDINFKSSFGVFNSSLIKFFLSTDDRLIPLFVTIKYWIKIHDIRISNYAIIMMVIFYLQRLPKPVLPPVSFLQRNPAFEFIKDGWNCGFDDSLRTFPKNHNTSNVLTLLEGFFHFYTNIDLCNVVISPLCGLSFPTDLFQNSTNLPSELRRYVSLLNDDAIKPFKVTNFLNVQDPFELNRNVTAGINLKVKDRFTSACSSALFKIEAARHDRCFDNLLYDLMTTDDTPYDPLEPTGMFCLKKIYPIPGFSQRFVSVYCGNLKLLLDNILRNILKCRFTVDLPLANRVEDPLIKYNCESFYNLWSTREDYNSKVPGDRTSMGWYVSVSEHILESLFKNQQPTCPLFKFLMEVTLSVQQRCIVVEMSNVSAQPDTFVEFANFMTSVIDMGMSAVFDN